MHFLVGALGRANSKEMSTPGRGFERLFLLSIGRGHPSPAFLPIQQGPHPGRTDRKQERQQDPEARVTETGRPRSTGVTWRPRGKEARRPIQKHKTASGHRCRFRLTQTVPPSSCRKGLWVPSQAIPRTLDTPLLQNSQPSTVRLWTALPSTACCTPAGMWKKAGIPTLAHRNTPPCRT